MPDIPITRVRYNEQQSTVLLMNFVFEGRYGGSRAPRGIEPAFVARFIRENVQPSSPPDAYGAVLDLIRFYERSDVLPHLRLALSGHEDNGSDILRSAYVLQALGDLGTREEAAQAAEYFDRVLVPYRGLTARLYPVFLDTLVALAPAGSPARLMQRLTYDLQRLAPERRSGEAGMMKYDELAAVERNNARKTNIVIEIKKRLAAQSADARRPELVRIYLGLSMGGALLGTWAARLLRKEAIERAADPVRAEFARAIDEVDEAKLGAERAKAMIARAAQAILYLQGMLSEQQSARVLDVFAGRGNFLWDR